MHSLKIHIYHRQLYSSQPQDMYSKSIPFLHKHVFKCRQICTSYNMAKCLLVRYSCLKGGKGVPMSIHCARPSKRSQQRDLETFAKAYDLSWTALNYCKSSIFRERHGGCLMPELPRECSHGRPTLWVAPPTWCQLSPCGQCCTGK